MKNAVTSALVAVFFFMLPGPSAAQVTPEAKLKALGIELPKLSDRLVGNYAPGVQVGKLLFMSGTSGQRSDGSKITGPVGGGVSPAQGYQAARSAGLTMLAQVRAQIGSLDRVKRVVRTTCFVNARPEFGELPKVCDGFSDLMVEVFGDAGRGARSTPGMGSASGQATVMCESIFEVE